MSEATDQQMSLAPATVVSSVSATPGSARPNTSSIIPELETDGEAQELVLEPDEGETFDDVRLIDDRISSYTASLTSSVVDYPVEYGRRYHAFRAGWFSLYRSERRARKRPAGHDTCPDRKGNWEQAFFLAPIETENVHRILDIGTGTGIWAMEMGDFFHHAEVIGNDLSPTQPEWVPPNVRFEIDDVESSWIEGKKYDFIFCRYMVGAIGDWETLVKRVFNNLNPGGWVELQDMRIQLYSDDETLEKNGKSTMEWIGPFVKALQSIGREPNPGPLLEGWVREHGGFDHIAHQKFRMPLGPWRKEQYYKDLGLLNLAQILKGLEGGSMRLFCGVLGWTTEEVLALLAGVRQELKSNRLHPMYDLQVLCFFPNDL
ncbi:UMTA methyltransferase [Colletotrichum higginsianum IMI 349063]|uniref:UMTA methyltransferase n=1 Tax=Colletotrichum higginsianum (strain IMI 349063) TaxID=759273 RepID=A0A1B7YLC3_COLHI|nr:UMTA methyltransferase [Colletotrichum higginsianum IMI 349063]OBR12762.1 UMTA methyltransferase [Colletotrichum higginsianum IMI 349063]